MAQNKTRPTGESVEAFISALANDVKRSDAETIVEMMQRLTGEKPAMWGPSIIGFGSYHYRYDSGREGDVPLVGFSPRKAALVFYIMTGFAEAETLLQRLGKHSTGKACLYIKKLADVDQTVLEELVTKSVAATRARELDQET